MHELAECQALVDQLQAIADREGGRVKRARVSSGVLSGVEPELVASADLGLLTKSDLAPFVAEFDTSRARAKIQNLGNEAPAFSVSAKSGEGLQAWLEWLRTALSEQRAARLAVA